MRAIARRWCWLGRWTRWCITTFWEVFETDLGRFERDRVREREREVSSGFPAHSAVAWWGWTDDELLYRNTHCFHGWRDRERLQMSTFRNFMDGEFYGVGFRLVWLLGVVCWGWLNTILENIFLIGSRLDGENLIVYEVELWIFFN